MKTLEQNQTLTRGEEEVMQALWSLNEATVNQIINTLPEPKPKYTTVATFIKILENKGFVAHTVEGRGHRYYPTIKREQYASDVAKSMLNNYFGGSLSQLVSFFGKKEDISVGEMDEILEIVEQIKNR
ncbi:MAG: BlaI/MecI/CopY family transcriptional regulator [Alistipes sp.]|nr:BlaI/MecI/CopY family transcriptional regulator [Alistipes sp.]